MVKEATAMRIVRSVTQRRDDARYVLEMHTDESALDRLAAAWRDLYERDERSGVFSSWTWVRHLWMLERQQGAALRLVSIRDASGRLMALAPLVIVQSFGTRVLRFVGQGPADYHDLLWASDACGATVQRLMREGIDEAAATCDIVDLHELPPWAHLLEHQRSLLPVDADAWHTLRRSAAWARYVPLEEDFEQYCASLERKFRSDVRRTGRRMHEQYTAEIVIEDGSHDPEAHIAALIRLHQGRRRAALERGLYRDQARREVFAQIYRAMFDEGSLWIVAVRLDGEVKAALAVLRSKQRALAYNAGLDAEGALRRLGLGRLCHLQALEQAFDAGYREYDLGRGDEPYKANFTSRPRQNARLLCYRRGWRVRSYLWRDALLRWAYRSKWIRRGYFLLGGNRSEEPFGKET